jgi:hypothetical protein
MEKSAASGRDANAAGEPVNPSEIPWVRSRPDLDPGKDSKWWGALEGGIVVVVGLLTLLFGLVANALTAAWEDWDPPVNLAYLIPGFLVVLVGFGLMIVGVRGRNRPQRQL